MYLCVPMHNLSIIKLDSVTSNQSEEEFRHLTNQSDLYYQVNASLSGHCS